MEPLTVHTGQVVPLDKANVDTDQIIPKQFLKRIERTGFGQFLFYDWRFNVDGSIVEDFMLNQLQYKGASILLARQNFGSGSSREHAPWALLDYGFRVIIAPSFADIFYSNCFKNSILPIVLAENEVGELFTKAEQGNYEVTIDLKAEKVIGHDGATYYFQTDPYRKSMLLNGLDDIGLTEQYQDQINAYEERTKSS